MLNYQRVYCSCYTGILQIQNVNLLSNAQQCSADQSGRFVLASVPKPALQCDAAKCSVTLRAVLKTKDLGI